MQSTNTVRRLLLVAVGLVITTTTQAQNNSSEKTIQPAAPPERVGAEAADALPLSLNEAIRLALENNNDIRTSRIDVEKAERSCETNSRAG